MKIVESKGFKIMSSKDFNLFFDKKTGFTKTFGATEQDDPEYCPAGPVIADIEISTICNQGCAFCYKSNTGKGENMSFETFKDIFHKLPRTLTQIAFGIGDIAANPDLKSIFDYCRENEYQSVVPNVTVNGSQITMEWSRYLAQTCGAVAVSYYDEDNCFNTVSKLTSLVKDTSVETTLKQVNIHCVLSEQSFESCMSLIDKVKNDPRLLDLNAVVFLMLKNKGRGENIQRISDEKYKVFVTKLFESGISFGFDSCGSGRLIEYGVSPEIEKFIEPCESGLFSMYLNTEGVFFPCSFTEDCEEWKIGIDVKTVTDFLKDVWYNPRVVEWRTNLLSGCRACPKYKI